MVRDSSVSADHDHRTWRLECIGDSGHCVGDARTRRDDCHARLAGDLCPALCGVRGHLFVSEVDYLDSLGDTSLIKVVDVAAVEGEDVLDALPFECLGEQSSAIYLRQLFLLYWF